MNEYLGVPRWAYDAEAQTAMLAEPVWDLCSRGGKHWRADLRPASARSARCRCRALRGDDLRDCRAGTQWFGHHR
ncbi:MAG: hypothetical protein MZV70_19675 [Desulfobacterales bacterium]|nr:hypothetical protein [Desulfobacterales bacterium]